VSSYPDLTLEHPRSFVLLSNEGGSRFAAYTHPATEAGRFMALDAGDLDGDGDPDVALGGFYSPVGLPVHDPRVAERLTHLREHGPSVLLLENTTR
jgi:hypothetical protein